MHSWYLCGECHQGSGESNSSPTQSNESKPNKPEVKNFFWKKNLCSPHTHTLGLILLQLFKDYNVNTSWAAAKRGSFIVFIHFLNMLLCIYVTPEEIYHFLWVFFKKAIIKYINIYKDLVKIVSEMPYNLCLWRQTLGHGLTGIS